jgi:hypothetical protein
LDVFRECDPKEKQNTGFTLDQNTIRELSPTAALELVKARSDALLVSGSGSVTAGPDEPEVVEWVGRTLSVTPFTRASNFRESDREPIFRGS